MYKVAILHTDSDSIFKEKVSTIKELIQTVGFIGFNDTCIWEIGDSLETICKKVCDDYFGVSIDDDLCKAITSDNILNLVNIESGLGFIITDVNQLGTITVKKLKPHIHN